MLKYFLNILGEQSPFLEWPLSGFFGNQNIVGILAKKIIWGGARRGGNEENPAAHLPHATGERLLPWGVMMNSGQELLLYYR